MEKKNKVLQVVGILAILLFGFYLGNISSVKKSGSSDIYKKETGKSEAIIDEFQYPLFTLMGKSYFFTNLPDYVQKRLIRERINYYRRTKDILSTVVIQKKTADEKKPNDKNKLEKLPDVVSFYSHLVDPKEVKEIYQKNISKFKKGEDPARIMLEIQIQLLTKRIVEHTKKEISDVYESGEYYFDNRDPFIPLSWFNIPSSPKLSQSNDAEMQIHIVMGYGCENCGSLGKDIGEILKTYDSKRVSISLFHYSDDTLDKTYYLNKAALCVHEQSKDLFWKFNLALLKKNSEIKLLKSENLGSARKLFMETLKDKAFDDLDNKEFEVCLKEERSSKKGVAKNKIAAHLSVISSEFKFLSGLKMPIVFVNGRRLNPEVPISLALKTGVKNKWFQIK